MTNARSIPRLFAALLALAAVACSGSGLVEPEITTSGTGSGSGNSSGFTASGSSGGAGSSSGFPTASGSSSSGFTGASPGCVQGTPCADFFNVPIPPGAGSGGFGCGTLPTPENPCTTNCVCEGTTGYLQCTEQCPTGYDGGSSVPPSMTTDAAPACEVPYAANLDLPDPGAGDSYCSSQLSGWPSVSLICPSGSYYMACGTTNYGATPAELGCAGPGLNVPPGVTLYCCPCGLSVPVDAGPPDVGVPLAPADAGGPSLLDSGEECATSSDCSALLGPLPPFCLICSNGSQGCEHYVCSAGLCATAYCDDVSGTDGATSECQTASDCETLLGPQPAICTNCPNGTEGCLHYVCLAGICQTSYCN